MSQTQQQTQVQRQLKKPAKKPNKENDNALNANHQQDSTGMQQSQQALTVEKKTKSKVHSKQIDLNQEIKLDLGGTIKPKTGVVFSYLGGVESANTTQNIGHQASMSQSFSRGAEILQFTDTNTSLNVGKTETLDSNGNAIRGRKLDSPQLVVVKELRDLEDQEEGTIDHKLISQAFGTKKRDDDLALFWNGRDKSTSEKKKRKQRLQAMKESKSAENKNKTKQKSKNRGLSKEQVIEKVRAPKSTDQSNVIVQRGVKSSREIRSSMGFQELLNQLDKDMSIQQQSNQVDFKNRTAHDLLRLELSAIRKQNNSGAQVHQSKSQERSNPITQIKELQQQMNKNVPKPEKTLSQERKTTKKAVMPKSINIKREKDHNQMFKMKPTTGGTALTENTPEKHQGINGTSFLQSEHGRAQTSHAAQHQQTNLNTIFNQIKSSLNTHINRPVMKDQSSPDRGRIGSVGQSQNVGNIDKLIRANLKKQRSKEEEERLAKELAMEQLRKKRDLMEMKNTQVRRLNREKVTKRLQNQQVYQNIVLANEQQAQDDSVDSRVDEKMVQINRNIKNRERFMQKSSQSQKIDFDKFNQRIQEQQLNGKIKKLSIKNHRKSYGLEFIDIKKEIQEELRTIDLKYKNKEPGLVMGQETSTTQIKTLDNTQKQIKLKLKTNQIKKTPKPDETLPLSMISNGEGNFGSERMQPINKVIVVKKSKIRKFMKKKKKNLIIKQLQEQNNELVKILKMQQNQIKLNDFCKKNLEKQLQKKKTSHGNQDETVQVDQSKISGRRIIFDNIEKQKHIYEVMKNEENPNDTSRLSTEFYEEYFRLINSIKKEASDVQQQSRADGTSSHNITSKSMQNLLLKSPGLTTNPANITQSPMGTITKGPLSPPKNMQSHNQLPDRSDMIGKQVKLRKTQSKSKSNLKHTDSQEYLIKGSANQMGSVQKSSSTATHNKLQSVSKQTIRTVGTGDISKINMRAESAPLLLHQSLKKKQVSKENSNPYQVIQGSIRKPSPQTHGSSKEKDNTKKKSSMQSTTSKIPKSSIVEQSILKSNKKPKKTNLKNTYGSEDGGQEMMFRYFLGCVIKIQRAMRTHLQNIGFYDSYVHIQDESSNAVPQQQSSEEVEYQTQIFDGGEQTIFDQQEESPVKHQQIREDASEDENSYGEEDEGMAGSSNMIIIDQKGHGDHEKKVVYLSNINSCSLPESPKEGISQHAQSSKLLQKKGVFEYKPGMLIVQPNQFFSQSLSATDQVHQQISQKPSLESNLNSDSGQIQTLDKLHSSNEPNKIQTPEEEFKQEERQSDYKMRLFAGSESLLREFKQNTPKQQLPRKEELSIKQRESKREQGNSDITSQSSQSVFERNSFQQFTMQKLQQLMKNNEFMNIIDMREKALEYRKAKEKKFIRKMLKDNKMSPRTYTQRKEQLEKWVVVEKEEISKTKHQFEQEWEKTIKMIEDTQKNVDQMKLKIDNRFNSANSSRNSQSSYVSNRNRKSILEQEEYQPNSQRSMRLSICSQVTIEHNKSINNQQAKDQQQAKDVPLEHMLNSDMQRENLMDFLEKSWQKTQSKFQKDTNIGIFIEDQKVNEVDQQRDSFVSLDSERQIQDIKDRVSSSGEPMSGHKQFPQQAPFELDTDSKRVKLNKSNQNERSLMRSRSEQDLSELIKNNKINFNELDISELDQQQTEDKQGDQLESFRLHRVDESKKGVSGNEIRIQENLFEDSSQRPSQRRNQLRGSTEKHIDGDDDSLLNESELNHYFQDQKFSIEDFKSLDKRKLTTEEAEKEEEDVPTERHITKQDDSSSLAEGQGQLIENQQRVPSHQEMREDDEPSFSFLQRPGDTIPRVMTPDIVSSSAFLQHQQAILFQHAKPGENIKIADILRKSQNMTDVVVGVNNSLIPDPAVFQNQQINLSMNMPNLQPLVTRQELEQQVNQITEAILSTLLSSEISVPKREVPDYLQDKSVENPIILTKIETQQPIEKDNNADIFLIDAQQSEKELRREMADFRQRMLIEQDLIRVENYINEVIHSLQQSELTYLTMLQNNADPSAPEMMTNYHRVFLNVLTQPLKKQELELLNSLQTSEIGSYEHFETAQDINQNPILPIDLYLDIERLREESQLKMLYMNGQSEQELENSVIQEACHIHNKAIFDALNESLMKFRPYGISGEPMPWSNKNRRLQTKVDTNSVDTERLFIMVKQDVLRWAQVFSGCHPSPIFIMKKPDDTDQFDEELFQETRERRLAQMLAADVVENEHQWLNYEFEEAQVKIDLSDMILEHLVEEAALFLNFKQDLLVKQ